MNKKLAINLLRGSVLGTNEQLHEAVFMAIKALKTEPKHGRWETCRSGHYAVCTNCRLYWIPVEDKYDFWFCPRCGAKMDEVEE